VKIVFNNSIAKLYNQIRQDFYKLENCFQKLNQTYHWWCVMVSVEGVVRGSLRYVLEVTEKDRKNEIVLMNRSGT
jgi:Cft2 family RNA processing exonuclease